ncbi:F-box/LRR-repeat protein 2 [Armadillidium nasatum]|uniref:F-box/LRR-repeat protein 2 n=1 Tax=Armadillidium nasatum TaxID=96803 RepID=A0A5N5TJP5_9CRUS|nr:F-box/LRR-repeat protein 2 [Armadillidium nasatum]
MLYTVYNIDINYRGSFELVWEQCAEDVKSLKLLYVEISERDLISVLQKCSSLESLHLAGFSHMLMPGTFLENENDLAILGNSLKNVKNLQLSCSRYLTDSIFLRFTSVIGSLTNLSLSCCQISYQNAICKRFYPADGRVKASEHVLTFNFVLNFIDKIKKTLTMLDLGSTSLDSQSLSKLSKVPDLQLKTLRLVACDQLTKDGIHTLTQYQKQLVELDIGLCSRITDYAVISIADNLPNLKSLSVRRCHGITEVGMENLARLKSLEKLDISHLDVHRWESIHVALAKVQRPKMRWLSLILLQAICRSMVHLEVLLLNGCSAVSDIGLSGHGLGNREDPYKIALGSKAEKLIREEGEVKKYLKKNMSQIISSSECGLKNLPVNILKENSNLWNNKDPVNDEGVIQVSIHCPSLEEFFLSNCSNISDGAILVLSHRLRRLKALDVQKLRVQNLDIGIGFQNLKMVNFFGRIEIELES